jgi:hypothetical protein
MDRLSFADAHGVVYYVPVCRLSSRRLFGLAGILIKLEKAEKKHLFPRRRLARLLIN